MTRRQMVLLAVLVLALPLAGLVKLFTSSGSSDSVTVNLADLRREDVIYLEEHHVFAVYDANDPRALSAREPGNDADLLYCRKAETFQGDDGALFGRTGTYIDGPAERGMDRHPTDVLGELVEIDLSTVVTGPAPPDRPLPPPDALCGSAEGSPGFAEGG